MGRMERNGQIGSLLVGGRYRLVEKLGTGGMSVVWRGYDETLGRAVAVKVLSPRHADDQTFRDRLRQEALAAARLNHPHITSVFDFGESPLDDRLTVPYVVMELNDGESVGARIARQGPLAWRDAVTIAVEVASALATAHARGVVHRDVTPANVMLTGAGAKVVDFGIAAIVGQRDAAPDGSLLGTPAYLAPERLGGAQVSAATDVYALGLLLYRALTGRLPWPAETTAEALRAHLYADPDPLPASSGLPEPVRALCLRCLAKGPVDRPGAAEVARQLAAEVGMQPIIPPLTVRDARAVPIRGSASAWPRTVSVPGSASAVSVPGSASAVSVPGPASASFGAESSPSGTVLPPPLPVVWGGLGRVLLAYLGMPGGRPGTRPVAGVWRLRAGLRIGRVLRVGSVRPLGGGLFVGGGLVRDVLTGGGLLGGRHRARAVLVTLALVGATGVSWATTREAPEVKQAQAAVAGPAAGLSGDPLCAVRYQLKRDSGTEYEAVLTVATTDEVGRGSWRVQFSYPGSQQLSRLPKTVTQKGRRVIAKGHGTLQTFTLRGSYADYNPLPLSFTLDGRHRCRVEILGGVTGDRTESRPVSEAAGPEPKQPARGDRPQRAPRKSSSPRKRVDRPKPAVPGPSTPAPAGRKGDGFSLAL
jgi:serine/threonine protein kinase